MTVTVVQQTAGSSTTTNPTLAYPSQVTAGNFLLAYCMQESVTMPGIPTDSAGDSWQMIACEQRQPDAVNAPNGLSVCVYRARTAAGKHTSVTFPTATDSLYAVQECSGVAADITVGPYGTLVSQPGYVSAGFAGPATDFYLGINPLASNDYTQGIIVCLDQTVTWTLDATGQYAGWTVDASFVGGSNGPRVGMSAQMIHQVASSYVLAHWTASKPVVACLLGISLTHS